jgi:hypothetical protein
LGPPLILLSGGQGNLRGGLTMAKESFEFDTLFSDVEQRLLEKSGDPF